ncbi:hypothetical protein EV696_1347 [Permianibacter aggregans]|uniref:Uncharacterized protein n=1 Tax=Permianibacter aggregans TaxID=1510150 RepID=A0A4R6UBW8_9GAMM|nr:hypothetical protein EV696_1347 [Permianibacter aggregans]
MVYSGRVRAAALSALGYWLACWLVTVKDRRGEVNFGSLRLKPQNTLRRR